MKTMTMVQLNEIISASTPLDCEFYNPGEHRYFHDCIVLEVDVPMESWIVTEDFSVTDVPADGVHVQWTTCSQTGSQYISVVVSPSWHGGDLDRAISQMENALPATRGEFAHKWETYIEEER